MCNPENLRSCFGKCSGFQKVLSSLLFWTTVWRFWEALPPAARGAMKDIWETLTMGETSSGSSFQK